MNIFPPDGYDSRYWPQDGSDPKWTRWWAWYPVTVQAYSPAGGAGRQEARSVVLGGMQAIS